MTVAERCTYRPLSRGRNLFVKNGLRSLISIVAFNTELHKKGVIMKMLSVLSLLLIILFIAGCAVEEEERSPLEGAWNLVYSEWPGHNMTFPDQITGSSIKFFCNEHFVFAGRLHVDDVPMNYLGGGRYTLEGNRYSEMFDYHRSEDVVGTTTHILVEFRGDTLIQRWPANENWELAELHHMQKYVRMN